MKKILFLLIFAFSSINLLSAKEKLDVALQRVSSDVSARISQKTILCVLDFTSKSKEMGEYIRDSLISSFAENPNIRIVTRQNMDKVNKELDYQYSGYVSDATALSLCQRLGAEEKMPKTWRLFHTEYDNFLSLTLESYSLMKKILAAIANAKTIA